MVTQFLAEFLMALIIFVVVVGGGDGGGDSLWEFI